MLERARYTRDQVITAMDEVRAAGDALEGIVGQELLAHAHLSGSAYERVM